MKIVLFFIIMLISLVSLNHVLAESLTMTINNKIDYNFTRNYQLNFRNYQLEINDVKIKPLVSVNGIETDFSKVDYVVVVNDMKYYYNYSINLRNIVLKDIDYIAFNLTGLRRLDDISYTDGKLRYFFDDLEAYGNLLLKDNKVILYKPTSLSIDPIIELLGNSTNKFYVSGQTATERTPSYATTEFSQTNYNQTNMSENIRYNKNVAPVINGLPKWLYNRFTFNLSTIPSIETIKYCIEGYYTNLDATGGQVTYYYNVTSSSWVIDIPTSLGLDIESTKCKQFNNVTEVYNTTSGLFQFGSDISASYELPTNIYIDFINVTVNYTVTTTTTVSTTTVGSSSSTSSSSSTTTVESSSSTTTTTESSTTTTTESSTTTTTESSTTTTIPITETTIDIYNILFMYEIIRNNYNTIFY